MSHFLLQPLSTLKRVGNVSAEALLRLVERDRVFDLLLHKPLKTDPIIYLPNLQEIASDSLVIVKVKVESHIKPANSRQPYKILCRSGIDYLTLVFFKIYPSQLEKLKLGNEIAVLGRLQKGLTENQITHPQEIIEIAAIDKLQKYNVIYPMTYALTAKFLRQKIEEILENLTKDSQKFDWIDENLQKAQKWPDFVGAFKIIHNYLVENDGLLQQRAQKRLAYDELLAWQIAMLLVKKSEIIAKPIPQLSKNLADDFLQKLPFKPTEAQFEAAHDIKQDVLSNKKMLRLLQGDVGSGKTILAIYACLLAVAQNKQACVIVPITILADQHYEYFKKLLADFNLKIEILSGKQTKKQKTQILQELREGKIDILVSTHAVLQDDVIFKNLAIAVIDEQHRFGVMQRLKLIAKGIDVDVLLMSATPIPRSLMMAIYGDMDISILNQKPAGRLEINTLVMSQAKKTEIFLGVKRAISCGEKIYWLCPAIEESEEPQEENLTSAEKKFKELSEIFGVENVALIHGKMKESEKDKVMMQFVSDKKFLDEKNVEKFPKILVATTVIEVGIDVKDATIIVIENAENFGLSQLHQLRGRVGRGDKQSYCILLYGKKYGQIAQKRLAIMRTNNDGFYIAEEDLRLRGSGELLGTKQSGILEFKLADLTMDGDLLKIAHKNAQLILSEDPDLSKLKSEKYRFLLKLFCYDECLKLLAGG